MTRGDFILGAMGICVGGCAVTPPSPRPASLKRVGEGYYAEGDYPDITKEIFERYLREGSGHPVLTGLDAAFEKVMDEAKEAVITDKPAVWFVYNMGLVVKTRESLFAVDQMHRLAPRHADRFDFALITHNHDDHYTVPFYERMDGAHKTVVSNFRDNYGAHRPSGIGGYTRAEKTFRLKDVEIRTTLTDHNGYLVDFTTAFEIRVSDYTIFHSGDCSNVAKLNPSRRPNLWFVHPRCGMKANLGVEKFHPELTVIAHLNELLHNKYRWTWADGEAARRLVEKAGGKAIVPRWGERVV